jgi:hypothetical protein
MRRVTRPLALILLAGLTGCALRGAPISPYGRAVTLHPESGMGPKASGELLAVSRDSIWLNRSSAVVAYPVASLRQVRVQRHRFGFQRTMKWMGIAGLGTGSLLMVACNSYYASEGGGGDGDCIGLVPGSLLLFGAAGLLFGAINELTTRHYHLASETEFLRTFARYPQGLPDSLRRTPAVLSR